MSDLDLMGSRSSVFFLTNLARGSDSAAPGIFSMVLRRTLGRKATMDSGSLPGFREEMECTVSSFRSLLDRRVS